MSLSSENPSVTVPTHVRVAAGASSASFPISTHPVSNHRLCGIAASVGGVTEKLLMTVPSAVPPALTVSSRSVVGGTTATGVMEMTGPASGAGVLVSLKSCQVGAVPATVLVAAGETRATFPITTRAVTRPTSLSISATRLDETQSATLVVSP